MALTPDEISRIQMLLDSPTKSIMMQLAGIAPPEVLNPDAAAEAYMKGGGAQPLLPNGQPIPLPNGTPVDQTTLGGDQLANAVLPPSTFTPKPAPLSQDPVLANLPPAPAPGSPGCT